MSQDRALRPRASVWCALLLSALLSACSLTPAGPLGGPRLTLSGPGAQVAAYGLVELTIGTDQTFSNPFDPAEADLWVRFTAPDGGEARVPAFWYQGFDPQTLQPAGEPGWRVRFTPAAPGQWRAQAELSRPAVSSAPVSFTVTDSLDAPGFVRLDKANSRYFAFDDGSPYTPIGANIAWASGAEQTIAEYERWFGGLSANGGNIARLWMASWGFGIEWNDTGLGDYSGRMRQAYLLDRAFQIAEQHDIYIMLCLLNHGAFSTSTNPEWDGNPYNAANGGMLKSPADFVTDPQAKELFKRRLRYIAARWGYSPNLFAWEWWNEVNWTPIGDDALIPWAAEMADYLRQLDPNHHLISSSYSDGTGSRLWAEPSVDFAQQHDYGGNDPVRVLRESIKAFHSTAPDKPALLAEHGYSAAGAAGASERIHFHNGIWAPVFLGFAGSGMAWWWDSYIDPGGLWSEYRPLADFLAGERLADLSPARAGAGNPDVYALSMQNSRRALLWLRNRAYDAQAAYLARAGESYEPPQLSGLTLTVSGLDDGAYTARWLDPQSGAWLDEVQAGSTGGTLTIAIPAFTRDLALKITPEAP